MMQAMLFHLKAFILNILTCVLNLFIRRDKRIWLFGSWMGTRFADNSRYLFQYLNNEKERYDIKNVIWITRNKNLRDQLHKMGYEVELACSLRGIYAHLKAGVHVVCNMAYTNGGFLGDINGNLSSGAIKIQLWHGFPIKSNVRSSSSKKNSTVQSSLMYRLSLPGRWTETQYVASMSKDCTRRYRIWFNNPKLKTIECGYPRDCECVRLTEDEEKILEKIKKFEKTIMYLPTFRGYPIEFKHPLTDKTFCEWIVKNNVLWIEKPHLASSMTAFFNEVNNNAEGHLLRLEGAFDVNVLMPLVSAVVTDYSSVSADAIYFDRPVVYYIPDFDQYCGSDRGLTDGFDNVTYGAKVYSPSEMTNAVAEAMNYEVDYTDVKYLAIRDIFFDARKYSYDQQIKDILNAIKL